MLPKLGKVGQLEANQIQIQAQLEDKPSNISLQFLEHKFESYATQSSVNVIKGDIEQCAKKSAINKMGKEVD